MACSAQIPRQWRGKRRSEIAVMGFIVVAPDDRGAPQKAIVIFGSIHI